MRNRQLYTLTSSGYEAPAFVDPDGALHTYPADNVPLIQWPNGQWCFEANRYMRELYERGLSRRDAGGTLATVASQISHFLRYCWNANLDPYAISDNEFCAFVGSLSSEKNQKGQRVRSSNTVIDVGRRTLDFLHSIGMHVGDALFVAKEGRIAADRREMPVAAGRFSRSGELSRCWHHHALPLPDAKTARGPIAKRCIDALRRAAISWARSVVDDIAGTSPSYITFHTRDRRIVMLLLLEITGARRREIARITVSSVLQAKAMANPMLRIPSIKRKGGKVGSRLIPIAGHDLQVLLDFVEFSRAPLMRKLRAKEHGYLLVNSRKGSALSWTTITNEIKELASIAQLEESVSPHLFRHRFITKLFISLIEQQQLDSKDAFKKLLLDSERMKQKVMEWTGHKSLKSLEIYINYAFDEISDFKKTLDLVGAKMVLETAVANLEAQLQIMDDAVLSAAAARRVKAILAEAASDLRRIVDSPIDAGEGVLAVA